MVPALKEFMAKWKRKARQQTSEESAVRAMAENADWGLSQSGKMRSLRVCCSQVYPHYYKSGDLGTENKKLFFLLAIWLPSEVEVLCFNIYILSANAVSPLRNWSPFDSLPDSFLCP